jgi:hypothetical protein
VTHRPRRGDIVSHVNENTGAVWLYRFGTDPEVGRVAIKTLFYASWALYEVDDADARYVRDVGDAVAWVLGE